MRFASLVESSLYALPYHLVHYRCCERAEDRNRNTSGYIVCSDPIQFRSGLCLIFSTSGYIAVAARLGDMQEVSECGPPGGFLIMCVDEPYYVVNR